MPRPLAVLAVLLLAAAVAAEPPTSAEHIPATERPRDPFYGAIAGKGPVAVRWEVTTSSVPVGRPFTLTLVVSNAANPTELIRPPLADFPEFKDLFSAIEDLPDEPPAAEVRFSYKLTPRKEGTCLIPELTYRYYQPRAVEGARGQTAFAESVTVTVTKPAEEKVQAVPLVAPAEFFERREGGAFTRSGGPSGWLWAGLFAGGIVVGLGWVFGWRVLFPDAARLAAIRRNKAVRIALDRLRRPGVTADAVAVTLRNYLIARWGLAFTAQTPGEVAGGLTEVGVSPERASEAEELLRECDAARFAGAGDTAVSAKRATAMIERWEGVRQNSKHEIRNPNQEGGIEQS